MLKTIVRQSPQLVSFLIALHLALSKPQMQHLTQLVDGPMNCEHRKTLNVTGQRRWLSCCAWCR